MLKCRYPKYGRDVLAAIVCPSTLEIVGYKLRVHRSYDEKEKFNRTNGYPTLSIPSTHSFLDEPVFSPPNDGGHREGEGEEETERITLLNFLRFPEVSWQITPETSSGQIQVSPSTTVRSLVLQTWEELRKTYLSDPHPDVEKIREVRFSFHTELSEQWTPVLQLDVISETGKWVGDEFILRGVATEPRIEEMDEDWGIYERVLPMLREDSSEDEFLL
ncbi:hypothetical protein TWF281_002842 [Arthrobotrys megalospora]